MIGLFDQKRAMPAGSPTPSDADVIACAVAAVAQEFGMTFDDALTRLAEVHEWQVAETEF